MRQHDLHAELGAVLHRRVVFPSGLGGADQVCHFASQFAPSLPAEGQDGLVNVARVNDRKLERGSGRGRFS